VFITFEGPDGSGKTTQLARLAARLRAEGRTCYTTREPGGTPIGDQIRAVLHDLKNEGMHPRTEILLYAASRAQLVAQEIAPRVTAGEIVLSDRYADSTLAYQGYGRGLDLDALRAILRFATGGLQPDLTVYLDVAPEVGLRRRMQAAADEAAEWNRLDAESLAFHQRVRAGYLALIAQDPARWATIPGEGEPDTVHAAVWKAVAARLPAPRG